MTSLADCKVGLRDGVDCNCRSYLPEPGTLILIARLTLAALNLARFTRRPRPGIIFHTDRGIASGDPELSSADVF